MTTVLGILLPIIISLKVIKRAKKEKVTFSVTFSFYFALIERYPTSRGKAPVRIVHWSTGNTSPCETVIRSHLYMSSAKVDTSFCSPIPKHVNSSLAIEIKCISVNISSKRFKIMEALIRIRGSICRAIGFSSFPKINSPKTGFNLYSFIWLALNNCIRI